MGKKQSSPITSLPSLDKRKKDVIVPDPCAGFEYEVIRLKGAYIKFYLEAGRVYLEIENKDNGTLDRMSISLHNQLLVKVVDTQDDITEETWRKIMNLHSNIAHELHALKSANCIKRLVSGNRYRYRNADFDLDLVYITSRVIAMGFPSTGYETLYRNGFTDVLQFFMKRHNAKAKIYNLCEEDKRLYSPTIFVGIKVANFPFKDHNPCRIELMYDFVVDAFLFLQRHKENVIAVHCKAGKGRTGIMICAYLIFMELADTASGAIDFYNKRRTVNGKGITIPSQMRYLYYFDHFLKKNIKKPYVTSIEEFLKNPEAFTNLHVNQKSLQLKQIIIGPFEGPKASVKILVSDFDNDEIYKSSKPNRDLVLNKTVLTRVGQTKQYFLIVEFVGNLLQFEQDFRIAIEEKKRSIKFYYWLNANYIAQEVSGLSTVQRGDCTNGLFEPNLIPKGLEDMMNVQTKELRSTILSSVTLKRIETEDDSLSESDLEEELSKVIEDIKRTPHENQTKRERPSQNQGIIQVYHVTMNCTQLDKFSSSKYKGHKDFQVITTFISEEE